MLNCLIWLSSHNSNSHSCSPSRDVWLVVVSFRMTKMPSAQTCSYFLTINLLFISLKFGCCWCWFVMREKQCSFAEKYCWSSSRVLAWFVCWVCFYKEAIYFIFKTYLIGEVEKQHCEARRKSLPNATHHEGDTCHAQSTRHIGCLPYRTYCTWQGRTGRRLACDTHDSI